MHHDFSYVTSENESVEETDKETLVCGCEFTSGYYAPCKAKRFPLSIILKARKL